MSHFLSSSCYHWYVDTNKYCNILLKMHISTMSSSPRVCSCQNHGPKLSVSRLSWGRPFPLKQLPCLAGNLFTACLIHHNQTGSTAVMQLQYVSLGKILCAVLFGVSAGVHPPVRRCGETRSLPTRSIFTDRTEDGSAQLMSV